MTHVGLIEDDEDETSSRKIKVLEKNVQESQEQSLQDLQSRMKNELEIIRAKMVADHVCPFAVMM